MPDLDALLTAFLLTIAAASVLAFGLSLLALAWRGRRAAGSPSGDTAGDAGPRHWSSDEYAERLRRIYFQKERRARALREQERRARAAAQQRLREADAAPEEDREPAPPTPTEGYYRTVLELEGEATPERVRLAYRRLIAAYHPDKVAGLGVKLQRLAEEETKRINEAYAFFRERHGGEAGRR